jgi:phospholipid/cholesterol/gamma-HCH transport system ATP-binding protein
MATGVSLRGVSFGYGEVRVLRNVTFEVPSGGSAVVAGGTASGKSTFLHICAGLIPVQQGIVMLGSHRADALHPSEAFHKGVRRGFVFQEGGILSNMNALANVGLPLQYHADLLGLSSAAVERRAKSALERVGIVGNAMYALPAHLSFGMRKRLALARAVAVEPNFFFFDDPDVGLDQGTAALIHEILTGFRDDPKVTMVVATNRELLIDRLHVPGFVLADGAVRPREQSQPPASIA